MNITVNCLIYFNKMKKENLLQQKFIFQILLQKYLQFKEFIYIH